MRHAQSFDDSILYCPQKEVSKGDSASKQEVSFLVECMLVETLLWPSAVLGREGGGVRVVRQDFEACSHRFTSFSATMVISIILSGRVVQSLQSNIELHSAKTSRCQSIVLSIDWGSSSVSLLSISSSSETVVWRQIQGSVLSLDGP